MTISVRKAMAFRMFEAGIITYVAKVPIGRLVLLIRNCVLILAHVQKVKSTLPILCGGGATVDWLSFLGRILHSLILWFADLVEIV